MVDNCNADRICEKENVMQIFLFGCKCSMRVCLSVCVCVFYKACVIYFMI